MTSKTSHQEPIRDVAVVANNLKSCCANLYELPVTQLILGDNFRPGGLELTEKMATAALVGRGSDVLDVASGIGSSARTLARKFGCNVVGLDFSAANVGQATALTKSEALDGRARFVEGDAEALPFKDDSFDAVFCECALCTFPSRSTALAEMLRVLKPRGRVAISDVLLNVPVPMALDNVMSHVLCIRGALSEANYRRELETAGFRRIKFRDASASLHELVQSVERRIEKARQLAHRGDIELPASLEEPGPALAAAKALVQSGGLGYGVFVAQKPGVTT